MIDFIYFYKKKPKHLFLQALIHATFPSQTHITYTLIHISAAFYFKNPWGTFQSLI